jgi:ribosome biogenesis GTPase
MAAAGLVPGRVCAASRQAYALTPAGFVEVVVQRRSRRAVQDGGCLPVVGDWLALEPLDGASDHAALREVLPRTGALARAHVSAARPEAFASAQVLAANVDVALLVSAFGHDLNPRRIERYLLTALAGGVRPVIVVNKADLVAGTEREAALAAVHRVAAGTPVHAISVRTGEGLDAVRRMLEPAVTGCLLGSSGVGKSSLINALLGEDRQLVRGIRADDGRGRHTTTARELLPLPWGALLIDTPGLRAIAPWEAGDALPATFADVEHLALACRFRDCRHDGEPGCAVQAAVTAGDLPPSRVEEMRQLEREAHSLHLRSDVRAARAEGRRRGRMYREIVAAKQWRTRTDD